jgi:hypothetical protein
VSVAGSNRASASTSTEVMIKPYLSMSELSELTPWSEDSIKKLMQREVLQRGQHWFHFGRRIVFKWAAIVTLIEKEGQDCERHEGESVVRVPMLNGGVAYVPATKRARYVGCALDRTRGKTSFSVLVAASPS